MRRILFSLFFFTVLSVCWGQNGFFFGHYMFNQSNINPSWSGSEQSGYVAFQHRSQWAGYSSTFDGQGGAPSTQMITAVAPIRNFPLSSIGINIVNDNLGAVSDFHAILPITYTFRLGSGSFHFGIAPSLFSHTQNFTQLRPNEPDPNIPVSGEQTQTKFNLGSGVSFMSDNNWFLGLSGANLIQPTFDFGQSFTNRQETFYSLFGGYLWNLSEEVSFSHTLLLRTNARSVTFDLSTILTLRKSMWAGLSYRRSESAIVYLGYSLLSDKRLKIGYSFDYVFQNQDGKAPTSHEIFIRYDLPNLVFGGKKRVVTPRFSF